MKTLKDKSSTSRIKASEEGQINVIVCLELKLYQGETYAVHQMGFYNSETKKHDDIVFDLEHIGLENGPHFVKNKRGVFLIREDGKMRQCAGEKNTRTPNIFFKNIISSASGDRPINLLFYSRVEMEYFGKMFSARILEHDNLIFSCFQDYIQKKGFEFEPLDKHLDLREPVYSSKKQCLILKEKLLSEYETKQCLFTSHQFPFPSSAIQDIKVDKGFCLTISCCQIQTDRSAWVPHSVPQEIKVISKLSSSMNENKKKSSETKGSVATLKKEKETKGMVVAIKKGYKTKRSAAILEKGFSTKNKNENTAGVSEKRKHDGVLVKKYNSYQSGSSLNQVQTKAIPSLLDIPTKMPMRCFPRKSGFPHHPSSSSSRFHQTSVWEEFEDRDQWNKTDYYGIDERRDFRADEDCQGYDDRQEQNRFMEYNRVEESGWREGEEMHRIRAELVLTTSRHVRTECSETKVHKKMTEMSGKEISKMRLEERKAVESSRGLWESRDMELLRGLRDSRKLKPSREFRESLEWEPFRGYGETSASSSSSRFGKRRALESSEGFRERRALESSEGFGEKRKLEPLRGFGEMRAMEPSRGFWERREVEPSRGLVEKREVEPSRGFGERRKVEPSRGLVERIEVEPSRGFGEKRAMKFSKESWEGRAMEHAKGFMRERREVEALKEYEERRAVEPSRGSLRSPLNKSTKHWAEIDSSLNDCERIELKRKIYPNDERIEPFRGFDKGFIENAKYAINKVKDGQAHRGAGEELFETDRNEFIDNVASIGLGKTSCNPKNYEVDGFKSYGVTSPDKRSMEPSKEIGNQFLKPSMKPVYGMQQMNPYSYEGSNPKRQHINSEEVKFDRPGIIEPKQKDNHFNNGGMEPIRNAGPDPFKSNQIEFEKRNCIRSIGVEQKRFLDGTDSSGAEFNTQYNMKPSLLERIAKVVNKLEKINPTIEKGVQSSNMEGGVMSSKIHSGVGSASMSSSVASTNMLGHAKVSHTAGGVWSTHNLNAVSSNNTASNAHDGSTNTKWGAGSTHTTVNDGSTYNVDAVRSIYNSGSVGSAYTMTGFGSTDTKWGVGSTSTQGSRSLNTMAVEDEDAEMARVELEIKQYEKQLKLLRHQRLAKELEEERKLAMNNQQNQQRKNEQTRVEEHNSRIPQVPLNEFW